MSELIESIERRQMRRELPSFQMGDRVRVHFQVVEGIRRRTQVFEGVVIRVQGSGSRRTFTVRKLSFGVGVERTFPIHSPKVERLEVVARGETRRAKLYYLRGRIGRRARLRERRDFAPQEWRPGDAERPSGEGPDRSAADGGDAEAEEPTGPEAAEQPPDSGAAEEPPEPAAGGEPEETATAEQQVDQKEG